MLSDEEMQFTSEEILNATYYKYLQDNPGCDPEEMDYERDDFSVDPEYIWEYRKFRKYSVVEDVVMREYEDSGEIKLYSQFP